MNNQLNPMTGPNFCPNCGCNIKAIALSMAFAAGQFNEPEAPKQLATPPVQSLARGIEKSKEVARLWEEAKAKGKNMTELSMELKMSTGTIWYHVDKVASANKPKVKAASKPPTPTFRPVISKEMKDDIFRRYKAGEAPIAIAKSLGLKHTTVGSIIYKRNHAERERALEVAV